MCVAQALVVCVLYFLQGAVRLPRALGSLGSEHSLHFPSLLLCILHVVSCWMLCALTPEFCAYCIARLFPSAVCDWGAPLSREDELPNPPSRG